MTAAGHVARATRQFASAGPKVQWRPKAGALSKCWHGTAQVDAVRHVPAVASHRAARRVTNWRRAVTAQLSSRGSVTGRAGTRPCMVQVMGLLMPPRRPHVLPAHRKAVICNRVVGSPYLKAAPDGWTKGRALASCDTPLGSSSQHIVTTANLFAVCVLDGPPGHKPGGQSG